MEGEFELELDDDGYPTDETLETIKNFVVNNDEDCEKLLQMASKVWLYPDYFTKDESTKCWFVSTGGWSGNKDVIRSLEGNHVFWMLYWKQTRVGGHYVFGSWKNQLIDTRTDIELKCELFRRNGLMDVVGGQLAYSASVLLDILPDDIRSSLGGRSLARSIERWNEQIGSYNDFLIRLEEIDDSFYREYQRRINKVTQPKGVGK
jgi:hypothetical protein